jgi:hypothetical protein
LSILGLSLCIVSCCGFCIDVLCCEAQLPVAGWAIVITADPACQLLEVSKLNDGNVHWLLNHFAVDLPNPAHALDLSPGLVARNTPRPISRTPVQLARALSCKTNT